jgi:osmotically-inducible protein OsmY
VRDKFVCAQRKTRDAADATARDLSNRARGVAAEARSALRREPVDGSRLVDRVRATLGRATSHPRAIDVVAADGGAVILEGPILAAEAERVLSAAWSVPGVGRVIDHLQRHDTPDGVPSLQ